jgi:hypothetical protein
VKTDDLIEGAKLLGVGGNGFAALTRDNKIHWVAVADARNQFRGVVPLPDGVDAGSVVGLAFGAVTIAVVTRAGIAHVFNRSTKTWFGSAPLLEPAR